VAAAALSGVALTGTSLVLAGPGGVAGATSSHQTIHISSAKIPSVGTVLTTSSGLTLYRFANDPSGTATCTGACAKIWPPVLASKGAHIAGPKGVKGFSLIRVGNNFQLAFHHVALYRFTGDKKKGQAKGQGVANAWFAVLKSGVPVTAGTPVVTPTPATPTPATQTPSTVTPSTQAPTRTTSPPASQTPMTQVPPTTPPTSPPTTTPTTTPPTTTTTQPSSAGGGGVSF
jgi:predicted lipoprotein with Yx(FWY)xxD motif